MMKAPRLLLALTLLTSVLSGCSSMQPAKVQLDDSEITTAVKAKLAADPDVAAVQVDVTTNESVVTLTGRVKTSEERMKAVQIARETNGVKKVNDLIKVGEMPANPGGGGTPHLR
jgi:osmotically-inducible protein OsmY